MISPSSRPTDWVAVLDSWEHALEHMALTGEPADLCRAPDRPLPGNLAERARRISRRIVEVQAQLRVEFLELQADIDSMTHSGLTHRMPPPSELIDRLV